MKRCHYFEMNKNVTRLSCHLIGQLLDPPVQVMLRLDTKIGTNSSGMWKRKHQIAAIQRFSVPSERTLRDQKKRKMIEKRGADLVLDVLDKGVFLFLLGLGFLFAVGRGRRFAVQAEEGVEFALVPRVVVDVVAHVGAAAERTLVAVGLGDQLELVDPAPHVQSSVSPLVLPLIRPSTSPP